MEDYKGGWLWENFPAKRSLDRLNNWIFIQLAME